MYLAELHGKLSSKLERREDILTSNVFSFFKYSNRSKYLKSLMKELEIKVSDEDIKTADFVFWPKFDDKTEPDLVIIIGKYYLLLETKYFSDFSIGQIKKEIEGGKLEAKNLDKIFYYIAITQDYFFKPIKFKQVTDMIEDKYFRRINWQKLCNIIECNIKSKEEPDYLMASDLYQLLLKKNLRQYQGFKKLDMVKNIINVDRIFFDAKSTKYRGKFIGFIEVLKSKKYNLKPIKGNLFFGRKYFCNFDISSNITEHSKIFMEVVK